MSCVRALLPTSPPLRTLTHTLSLTLSHTQEGGPAAAAELVQAVLAACTAHCEQWAQEECVPLPPAAIVVTSAATGDLLMCMSADILSILFMYSCAVGRCGANGSAVWQRLLQG
jgi:hypothetical protein